MKRLLLGVCLFLGSVPLWAQQAQTGSNGFQFIAPMRIAAGRDSNFLVDSTDPSIQTAAPEPALQALTDQVMTLTPPKIGFQNDSRRHEFFATWVPEFEVFQHYHDQNAMNQQATANFSYFVSRKTAFSLGETYRTSKDPALLLGNVYLLLPRSPYRENDVYAAFDLQPNPVTSIDLRYDNSYITFGQTETLQQIRLLDSISHGYSLRVARMLRPNHRIRANFGVFKIAPINHERINDDVVETRGFEHPIESGILEYRWGLSPSTILEFSGGLLKMDSGLSATYHATIDKRLGTFWLTAGYSRSFSYQAGSPAGFAQGLGSNGFFDALMMRVKGQPTRKTAILFDTTIARAASHIGRPSKSLIAHTRFDYRLDDRNVLFASLESLQQNSNAYVRTPLLRNRFMVGIEISLSSDTDRRSNHSNEDAQYVALTDHARRRSSQQ